MVPLRPMRDWLGYDARGKVNNMNGQLYSFDLGNRLRTVLGTETYRYDAHGRRVHVQRGRRPVRDVQPGRETAVATRRADRAALPERLTASHSAGVEVDADRGQA